MTDRTQKNRWRIRAGGAPAVVLSYRVFCAQRSVTTNWIGAEYAVLNGAPTFVTFAEKTRRPHEVRLELPAGWTHAMTGLEQAPGGKANHFRAADYETPVDSPILAGRLAVREFEEAGKKHLVVAAGDYQAWDGDAATRDLAAMVAASNFQLPTSNFQTPNGQFSISKEQRIASVWKLEVGSWKLGVGS